MIMRMRRTAFYGEAVDREMLEPSFKLLAVDEMQDYELPSDIPQPSLEPVTVDADAALETPGDVKPVHENYREIGAVVPLGFMRHRGENRTQRRAAVATWTPPEQPKPEDSSEPPRMPTRRELLKQRQRQRRGKLDPELRRLQRRKLHGT